MQLFRGFMAVLLLASATSVRAQETAFRVNDDQVKQVLVRLEQGADRFRDSLKDALGKSRLDDTAREENINQRVKDFEAATDHLRKNFGEHHAASGDATEVLERAARIDRFMVRQALTDRAQSDWRYIRENLDQLALAYSVTWTWDGAVQATRVNDDSVKGLLGRVEAAADHFRGSLDSALDHSQFDGRNAEDDINRFVRDFEAATDRWKSHFDDHNTAAADATEVLKRAAMIDGFMMRHPLTAKAQGDWSTLRATLDDLARAYNVTWSWAAPIPGETE